MRLKFVFWAEVSRINKQQSIGKVIPVSNINLQLFWYQFISILLGNLWSIPTMKAFPIFLYQLSELLENIWSWKWGNPVLSDIKTINQSQKSLNLSSLSYEIIIQSPDLYEWYLKNLSFFRYEIICQSPRLKEWYLKNLSSSMKIMR